MGAEHTLLGNCLVKSAMNESFRGLGPGRVKAGMLTAPGTYGSMQSVSSSATWITREQQLKPVSPMPCGKKEERNHKEGVQRIFWSGVMGSCAARGGLGTHPGLAELIGGPDVDVGQRWIGLPHLMDLCGLDDAHLERRDATETTSERSATTQEGRETSSGQHESKQNGEGGSVSERRLGDHVPSFRVG